MDKYFTFNFKPVYVFYIIYINNVMLFQLDKLFWYVISSGFGYHFSILDCIYFSESNHNIFYFI